MSRIQIRIHKFLCLSNPDHSISKLKNKKTLIFNCFVTSYWLSLKTNVNGSTVSNKQKNLFFVGFLKQLTKRAGSGFRVWVRNRVYRSKDTDLSHNVTNPEHWLLARQVFMYTIAFKHSANNFMKNARYSFWWSSSIGPKVQACRKSDFNNLFFYSWKEKR